MFPAALWTAYRPVALHNIGCPRLRCLSAAGFLTTSLAMQAAYLQKRGAGCDGRTAATLGSSHSNSRRTGFGRDRSTHAARLMNALGSVHHAISARCRMAGRTADFTGSTAPAGSTAALVGGAYPWRLIFGRSLDGRPGQRGTCCRNLRSTRFSLSYGSSSHATSAAATTASAINTAVSFARMESFLCLVKPAFSIRTLCSSDRYQRIDSWSFAVCLPR
jgi:hypothetical protein